VAHGDVANLGTELVHLEDCFPGGIANRVVALHCPGDCATDLWEPERSNAVYLNRLLQPSPLFQKTRHFLHQMFYFRSTVIMIG